MSSERKIATCMNCREEAKMAAHGLCFTCYRREERRAENPWAAAAKHERSKLKTQRKLRTAITGILNAVDGVIDIMEEEHVTAIRSACAHYLAALVSGLPSSESAPRVNSEREIGVNSSQPDTSFDVNSEQADDVNRSQRFSPSDADALVPGGQYVMREHPHSGYGVYDVQSGKCVAHFSSEAAAQDAIADADEVHRSAMQELIDEI